MNSHERHLPAGSTARGAFALDLDPARAGWTYSGLRVLELAPGARAELDTGDAETLVLPLAGGCVVECQGQQVELAGREDVFAGVSDVLYVPRAAHATVSSEGGGRFALPSAVCERQLPLQYVPADTVQVELRGAGRASRQVNSFGTPGVLDADRIIACEVLTPAGNWSSFPPHKHDEERDGESVLEEIYYYEIAEPEAGGDLEASEGSSTPFGVEGPGGLPLGGIPGGGAPRGFAFQRVYTRPETHPGRVLDLLVEVRSGDVVTMPYGWHGPSMAVPGYDLYYLNVMAGPGERMWQICDDPLHAWVRDSWEHEDVDPRLPFAAAPTGGAR